VRTFRVLAGRSTLETEVHSSIHPIHAKSSELTGVIEGDFDETGHPRLDSPHRGKVRVTVESIRSGSRLNDMEMQRRAEVGRYPTISFEIGRVMSAGDGQYRGSITVTAHGRTRTVQNEFAMRVDGRQLTATGQHTFDMRDFGMQPPRIFSLRVSPEVRVKVRLVAEEA
jgi:polyisoprenoid-binding protein YceI